MNATYNLLSTFILANYTGPQVLDVDTVVAK